jgi:thioesterase domain-containing protein
LFLVHAAHGNVLLYQQVASHLGPDQPVYGLQSEGLSGDGRLNSTVEEMASKYVKEIMTVQPHGPYLLGGYCLGGVVAFEVAQQLTALGEKVETVVLLDSYNPTAIPRVKALLCTPVHLLQNLWFHGANSVSVRGNDRRRFLREKVDIALTRLEIRIRATWRSARQLRATNAHRRDPHLLVKKVNDRAASRYVPKPYGGSVVLIRSKGDFFGLANPSFGWSDVVGSDLVISELPVYPRGMLIEPYCRLLADAIRSACKSPGRESIAA